MVPLVPPLPLSVQWKSLSALLGFFLAVVFITWACVNWFVPVWVPQMVEFSLVGLKLPGWKVFERDSLRKNLAGIQYSELGKGKPTRANEGLWDSKCHMFSDYITTEPHNVISRHDSILWGFQAQEFWACTGMTKLTFKDLCQVICESDLALGTYYTPMEDLPDHDIPSFV